ncbi:MAG: ABC-2 transporter permease, partial [Longimicrobiales bacterium]
MREGEARLKVMQKDLILNKQLIVINTVILLGCLSIFAVTPEEFPPRVYAGFAGFMMAFLPTVLITREDKFNAMTLGCSLPVSRKAIVQARFLLSLGMALVGIVGAFFFAVLLPGTPYALGDMFAWGPLITALTVIGLVLGFVQWQSGM